MSELTLICTQDPCKQILPLYDGIYQEFQISFGFTQFSAKHFIIGFIEIYPTDKITIDHDPIKIKNVELGIFLIYKN
jgi:hypothetical protein